MNGATALPSVKTITALNKHIKATIGKSQYRFLVKINSVNSRNRFIQVTPEIKQVLANNI